MDVKINARAEALNGDDARIDATDHDLLQRGDERGMLHQDLVYEALVHWADILLVATPIRWGVAGSLYFRMAARLTCVQNQLTRTIS
jgi:hypothetical protein